MIKLLYYTLCGTQYSHMEEGDRIQVQVRGTSYIARKRKSPINRVADYRRPLFPTWAQRSCMYEVLALMNRALAFDLQDLITGYSTRDSYSLKSGVMAVAQRPEENRNIIISCPTVRLVLCSYSWRSRFRGHGNLVSCTE